MGSDSPEYVDAFPHWVKLKAALKWKEVKKILKEETQAAERVKMLEKEVDERKKPNNYASLVPRLFPVP